MSDLKDPVFLHHQPLTVEFLEGRALSGLEGCYRTRLQEEGLNVDAEVLVGLVVQQNMQGEEEGCRVVRLGKVTPAVLNSKDFWPEAPEAKLTVLPFDLSEFPSVNGIMTSSFVELPFKVKAKQGESWRTVKEGERRERGYGALVMRLFLWPKTIAGGEFMVTCLPVSLDEMGTLGGQVKSRAYPGIKIHKGKFKFSSPELQGQRFGLGNLPFLVVSGLDWEAEDNVDFSTVHWMSSMDIKRVVSNTLAECPLPVWHNKAGRWREATQKGKFTKQMPNEIWPAPVMEDDIETAGELDSESEGRKGETRFWLGIVVLGKSQGSHWRCSWGYIMALQKLCN